MTTRRVFLMGTGAAGLLGLAGCMGGDAPPPEAPPAGPAQVTIQATGSAGMNPGPDGAERPITLTVLQLRAAPAFQAADFFALQNPQAALGGDLVSATQIALAPGASASSVIALDPSTTAVGIVGGYRDPAGKTFRAVAPVAPGQSATLAVGVTASGVSVSAA